MSKHSNPKLILLFESISLTMSVIVCCIGVLVLFGWVLDITLLKSILPDYIPMKPNSAIAFILSGISLILQRPYQSKKYSFRKIIGKSLGALIALFALMTIFQFVSGYDLHIDQLFITEQPSSFVVFSPGRSAPVTALNFVFIGLALILLDLKFTLYFQQTLDTTIGLIGLLILTGFTFNFHSSSQLDTYTYASLHAAFCFIFISISLLFIRPTEGIMTLFISDTNGGIVARRLIPIVILIPIIMGYLRILGEHYRLYDIRTGIATYSILITAILIIVTIYISRILMSADIRRLNVEAELRKSNHEIEDLYNNAPCGYHSLDKDCLFTHINDTELDWFEYTQAEIIGKIKFTDLMTPMSRRIFNENFQKLIKRGTLHDLELELVRKSGSVFTVLFSGSTMKDCNGKFVKIRSTMFDISERKRIEQALLISEERFHNAMDTAPIGMAIIALDGRYIEVNQALCHLVGYSKEELEKLTFQQITHPDDIAIDVANSQRLIRGEIRLHQIEKRYIRKNGEIIWAQLTASILRDTITDKPLYFIVQVEDITERKRTQDKIHQLAYYDTLTNLANRRLLLDRLTNAIALAKRHQRILAIMFMDLDKFKHVNDTLGHDVGDELLKAVAVRLNAAVRSEDTVARMSGDEFVVILNEPKTRQDAGIVAGKIVEAMKARFLLLGHEVQISCSIGITIYPEDGSEISDLMKKADTAMYEAKQSGRNQYRFHHHK